MRPRAYHRKISDQDIPQLHKFIEAMLSHEDTYFRDIPLRVVKHVCRHIMRSGHLHGSELMECKESLILSHPFLREKDRAGIIYLDCNDNDYE